MKKLVNISKLILGTGLLLFTMNSCKNEPKHDDPVATTENQNETKFESKDIADDSSFLGEAAEIHIFEIEVGKLAQKKATNPEVKKYADMMVADHSKSLEELKAVASKKTISLPTDITEERREKYDELNKKMGAEFDKKYIDLMTEGHEKAVDKMTKISQQVSDEDVKLWASRQIDAMITHHNEADKLKKKIK
ncbi:MAG: DUF4142 domain-containing protein [Flavobacterium sp.]|nr:DUF4142 domain-containing protein [Flavobacterium sp.]